MNSKRSYAFWCAWANKHYPVVSKWKIRQLVAWMNQLSLAKMLAEWHTIAQYVTVSKLDYYMRLLQNDYPLAYITKHVVFAEQTFYVDKRVLIPRNETTFLVAWAVAYLKAQQDKCCLFADLCTGSGVVGCAIAEQANNCRGYLTDIDQQALVVANINRRSLHLEKKLIVKQGDYCRALPLGVKLDFIVTNPPYVAIDDPLLADRVKRYEPAIALYEAKQGLAGYYQILAQIPYFLKPGGFLLVEFGNKQKKALAEMVGTKGRVWWYQDENNLDRYCLLQHFCL